MLESTTSTIFILSCFFSGWRDSSTLPGPHMESSQCRWRYVSGLWFSQAAETFSLIHHLAASPHDQPPSSGHGLPTFALSKSL